MIVEWGGWTLVVAVVAAYWLGTQALHVQVADQLAALRRMDDTDLCSLVAVVGGSLAALAAAFWGLCVCPMRAVARAAVSQSGACYALRKGGVSARAQLERRASF